MATRLRFLGSQALAINCFKSMECAGQLFKSMECAGRYLLEPVIGRKLDPSQASASAINI